MEQPPPVPDFELMRDAEHIKLLAIFHYVIAGLTALAASIPILHLVVGLMMLSGGIPMAPASSGGPDPRLFGWLFVGIGAAVIVIGWTLAVLIFIAGRSLSDRRRWNFVFVIACIQCLNFPLGTALGVMTILVLQRPSVRALFLPGTLPGDQLKR